jgi:hypothetical protein
MSSTKIVIIVLVLIALLFIIFVARGALRNDPHQDKDSVVKEEKPGWTKTIKGLFTSLQPKGPLKKKRVFTSTTQEPIPPDSKQPFRTITFHLLSGSATITYNSTPPVPNDFADLKDQACPLPNPRGDDRDRCSIVALKAGGTLNFACVLNTTCRVEVE